jgi:hypothetical protein
LRAAGSGILLDLGIVPGAKHTELIGLQDGALRPRPALSMCLRACESRSTARSNLRCARPWRRFQIVTWRRYYQRVSPGQRGQGEGEGVSSSGDPMINGSWAGACRTEG